MSDLPSHLSAGARGQALRSQDTSSWLRRSFLSCASRYGVGVLVVSLLLGLYSCEQKKVEVKNLAVNPDSLYTARTLQLNTLISDSGMIRYRMTAPELLIYERPERNEWVFPRGLVLRPYDLKQGSQVFIKADSAIRRPDKEEWELIGHVQVQGPDGQRLKTRQLFWLRDERRLYSNDTTYFFTQGKELRGSHFNAKDDLSWYEIYDNKGAFDYDEDKPSAPPASPSPSPASAPATKADTALRRAPAR